MPAKTSVATVIVGVGLGVLLVAASLGPLPAASSLYPTPPSGWTTFLPAEAAVGEAVVPRVAGPWVLVFTEGVAANGPWSPMAWQFEGVTPIGLCGVGPWNLNGVSTLTFWNASEYPFSTSSTALASGAAPLWTFVYENGSGVRIVGTWWLGSVLLNGVVTPTSPECTGPPQQPTFTGSTLNSNAAARYAQLLGGTGFIGASRYRATLYFGTGPTLISSYSGVGGAQPPWAVVYTGCGSPGFHGWNNTTEFMLNSTTGAWVGESINPEVCFDTEYAVYGTPTDNWTSSGPPGHYYLWSGFSFDFLTSAVPKIFTNSSLTTDMFDVSLAAGETAGTDVAPAVATCGPGSSGIADCQPPASGWFAVLLGQNGSWIDSFPSAASGTGWSVPGVHFLASDQLVLVASAEAAAEAPLFVNFNPNQFNPYVSSDLVT